MYNFIHTELNILNCKNTDHLTAALMELLARKMEEREERWHWLHGKVVSYGEGIKRKKERRRRRGCTGHMATTEKVRESEE